MPFFGEVVTVLNGVVNPWQVVTQTAVLLILVFVADASLTAWRRGDRRKALIVGGSVEFTIVAAVANAQSAIWGSPGCRSCSACRTWAWCWRWPTS